MAVITPDPAGDFSTLNGNFKQRYAPYIGMLCPQERILGELIKFDTKDLLGLYYNYPVTLTNEWGFTAAPGQEDLITLNPGISAQMQNAQLYGQSLYAQAVITYNAALAARTSEQAFDTAIGYKIVNLKQSADRLLEIELLYGSEGIMQVSAYSNVDTFNTTLTIVASSFSAGILSNLINAPVQFYNSSNVLISTGADSIFTVTKGSTNAQTVTVNGTTTGITALQTALSGVLDMYFSGFNGVEMAGLKKILTNTGTLFGIDASAYDLWRGNTYTVTGQLVRNDLNLAIAEAQGRGLNEDVIVLVNPQTFANLNTSESGSRIYPTAGAKGVNGFERLEFSNGKTKMTIITHIYVKAGDAFAFPAKTTKRVGSTDWTFNIPGAPEGEFFFHLPTQNGYVLRMVSNQALIMEKPAFGVYISGIVNS